MDRALTLAVVTWDGAGNLPPILALTQALLARGHAVHVLAHDSQRAQIEATGGVFAPFSTGPQWDVGSPVAPSSADFFSRLMALDEAAGQDLLALADAVAADAVLVDCLMPRTLTSAETARRPTVALVHALYGICAEMGGGIFKDPIDRADVALGLSYAAFDPSATLPANFHFVGPARPDLGAAPWPRRAPGKPFVVASQSTGLQRAEQADLLQRICDAVATLDVEALVTTGRGIAPESLIAGGNTTVERLVAHDASLSQADLMITHAGHGSVMAAVRFGVPMLCLPPAGDQPYNAAKVAQMGLGAVLDPSASSAEIRDAVIRLLDDKAVRARAKAIAAQVANAPGLERAVALVEGLGRRQGRRRNRAGAPSRPLREIKAPKRRSRR